MNEDIFITLSKYRAENSYSVKIPTLLKKKYNMDLPNIDMSVYNEWNKLETCKNYL